jgi:hypothetical protein
MSKVQIQDVLEAVQRDDLTGFCLACGEETEPGTCEPDAREYECDVCGENQVYGAEELLMKLA